jgi:hypothetical protein
MNLDDFSDTAVDAIKPSGKIRFKQRQSKPFLRGPIPMDWLYAAGGLPGQCLQVGIVLWHQAGIVGSRTISFRPSATLKFGMHRDTAARALRLMSEAGLIEVQHLPGKCSVVAILDVQSAASDKAVSPAN